jgi:hypothetical protein
LLKQNLTIAGDDYAQTSAGRNGRNDTLRVGHATRPPAYSQRMNTRADTCFPFDGRWVVVATIATVSVLLAITGHAFGAKTAWKFVGVNHLTPNFADTLVIVAGCESERAGFDQLVRNPADPWQRR